MEAVVTGVVLLAAIILAIILLTLNASYGWDQRQRVLASRSELRRTQVLKKYSGQWTSAARQQVVEYENTEDSIFDRPRWLTNGWHIVSIADSAQRAGCLRFILIGWLALLWKPPSHVRIVYERDVAPAPATTTPSAGTPDSGGEFKQDPHPSDAGGGLALEIERLAALKEQGLLTDEEFARAKQRLLEGA